MELKYKSPYTHSPLSRLLIVLNGIEIRQASLCGLWAGLLIVLNGIEIAWWPPAGRHTISFNRTKWNWNLTNYGANVWLSPLLIVLNGIEIWQIMAQTFDCPRLLIVLNGIEIAHGAGASCHPGPFNRTKWNWNMKGVLLTSFVFIPFNRTKWNWNVIRLRILANCPALLIVLNGIEIS